MNNQVRRITEGALMCALLGMLLVINRQLANSLGMFFVLIMPLPIVIYTVKYGFKNGVVVAFCVIVISLLFTDISTIIFVIMSMLLGVVYGSGIYKDEPSYLILTKSIIITMILEFMVGFFLAELFGVDILNEVNQMLILLQGVLDIEPALLGKVAFSLMIGSIALMAIMETLIVHLLSLLLLKRLKIKKREIRTIFEIKMPKSLAIFEIIACLVAVFITFSPFSDNLKVILLFIGYFSVAHLFMFGYIACLWVGLIYFKKNISLYLVILIVLLIFIALPLLVVLGFIYNVVDFKKMITEVKNG